MNMTNEEMTESEIDAKLKGKIEGYAKRAENVVHSFCKKDVVPQDLLLFMSFIQISGAMMLAQCIEEPVTVEEMIDATHELATEIYVEGIKKVTDSE